MGKMTMILLIVSATFFNLIRSAPTTSATTTVVLPLTDHFNDLLKLIPKDLIKNITHKHLQTDEEFKAAVKFVQSDAWQDRVNIIREKPEWVALKKYMKGLGINLDKFIKSMDGFLQNVTVQIDPKIPPPKKSVKAFLIDVEKNIPGMKILMAVHEKMIENPELQRIFDKISSIETRKLIDNVLSLPEIRAMLQDLADMDINIVYVLSMMYTALGWGELKFSYT